jgi:hypothetical protein
LIVLPFVFVYFTWTEERESVWRFHMTITHLRRSYDLSTETGLNLSALKQSERGACEHFQQRASCDRWLRPCLSTRVVFPPSPHVHACVCTPPPSGEKKPRVLENSSRRGADTPRDPCLCSQLIAGRPPDDETTTGKSRRTLPTVTRNNTTVLGIHVTGAIV